MVLHSPEATRAAAGLAVYSEAEAPAKAAVVARSRSPQYSISSSPG